MIDRARGRGLPAQAVFHHGTAADIPRREGWFDMVVCFAAFPHFAERGRTLAEFRRVLRPGGDIRIEHFKSRAGINSIHRRAGDVIVSHSIPDEQAMRTILVNAGFTVMEIEEGIDSYSLHAVKL
jgi:ubiquinone/menaquinone biosynthesis C-methylase UbiE